MTLTPGTMIYNPEVQKYFIFEDSCIECGDEYACIVSPEDTDDGKVPAGCMPGTNLHIDFWMGPSTPAGYGRSRHCEDNSTVGSDWVGGGGDVHRQPAARSAGRDRAALHGQRRGTAVAGRPRRNLARRVPS